MRLDTFRRMVRGKIRISQEIPEWSTLSRLSGLYRARTRDGIEAIAVAVIRKRNEDEVAFLDQYEVEIDVPYLFETIEDALNVYYAFDYKLAQEIGYIRVSSAISRRSE